MYVIDGGIVSCRRGRNVNGYTMYRERNRQTGAAVSSQQSCSTADLPAYFRVPCTETNIQVTQACKNAKWGPAHSETCKNNLGIYIIWPSVKCFGSLTPIPMHDWKSILEMFFRYRNQYNNKYTYIFMGMYGYITLVGIPIVANRRNISKIIEL